MSANVAPSLQMSRGFRVFWGAVLCVLVSNGPIAGHDAFFPVPFGGLVAGGGGGSALAAGRGVKGRFEGAGGA